MPASSAMRLRRLAQHVVSSSCAAVKSEPTTKLLPGFERPGYKKPLAKGEGGGVQDELSWEEYKEGALARAATLGNRSPMRYNQDGSVAQEIIEGYKRNGL